MSKLNLEHLEETTKVSLGYTPRRLQAYLHNACKRFNVIVCHRRFGKTRFSLGHLLDKALKNNQENPNYAYIAPTYGQAERVAWTYLKDHLRNMPTAKINEAKLRVEIHRPDKGDKITIWLLGAENPDSIRGIYLDGVILDEYAQCSPEIWGEVIRPALSDRKGWAVFIGTPKGMNAFYKMYQQAVRLQKDSPQLGWFAFVAKASKTGILDEIELDGAKQEMSDEEYEQEFECFPEGTLVATANGNYPIQDIRINDFVVTHTNRLRPVMGVMRRCYVGDIVTINSYGSQEDIKATPEHPFYVYNKNKQSYTWVKAKDLKVGDFLITPKINKGTKIITEDMAAILAWYITEGSVNGNYVQFSLNPHNQCEIDSVRELLERNGYTVKEYVKGCLIVCNTSLCDTLTSLGGCLAENKRIPFAFIGGHEQLFFETLMRGDGCIVSFQGGRGYKYTTISKSLAYDVQLLASMLGRRSSIIVREEREGVIEGRNVHCCESYLLNISYGMKVNHSKPRQVFPAKLGIATEIRSVKVEEFFGEVFNLSVKEDESYVANNKVVHNCSFQAALVGSYYGKYITEIEKRNQITELPYDKRYLVDTVWDLGIGDSTSIWFLQEVGNKIHVIDYLEASGMGLEYYASELKKKDYAYNDHWIPHDGEHQELGTGVTRQETLKQLGFKTKIVPKQKIDDGINAVRVILTKCWFDSIKCQRGLDALKNYEKKWDSKNNLFMDKPLHNWASHGADAFRYLALTYGSGRRKLNMVDLQREADNKYNHFGG